MNIFLTASKALGWNTLGTLLRSVIGLAQLALLSRYLNAEDLGTYSQFFLVSTILLMLSEFGLSACAISKPDLSKGKCEQLGYSYILNGLVISSLLVLSSSLLASFFKNPNLANVLILYSPAVVIMALGQLCVMTCQKKLDFKTIIMAETLGITAGFLVFCIALYDQLGLYSFVLGMLTNSAVRTSFLLMKVRQLYLAVWRFKFKLASEFYSYGAKFTAANLLSLLVTSSDIIFISRLIGLEQTGQYGVIKDLVFRITTMINPILTRVALPFYAKLSGHSQLGFIYCLVKELLCYLTVPIYTFFIIFPEESLALLLGEKWIHLAELLQLLSGWMIIRSVMSQSGSLLAAIGRVKQSLYWNIGVTVIFPIVIYVSAQSGIYAVACTLLIIQVCLYIPHWYWLLRLAADIPLQNYIGALIRPLFASAAALFLVFVLLENNVWPLYLKLVAMLLLAVVLYMLLISKRLVTVYKTLRLLKI